MTTKSLDEFRSPKYKLLNNFLNGRECWKEKHHTLKKDVKRLSNQVRAVENSRQHWRDEALELRRKVAALEKQIERGEKKC